jgi:methylmalonyl-CoA/ethylmalonyl-CoA epimerase
MVIDHVGIAVRSLEASIPRWRDAFGYDQATEIVVNTRQRVRVVFLDRNGSLPVKLIEPTGEDSPVHAFVRRGGGLHHLCFRADSVSAEVARLEALGLRVVAPPQPGEAFEDELIAFVYAGDGLNVEIIDTNRRAGRLPGILPTRTSRG